MSTKFTIMLALAAGFIGGLVSRHSGSTPAYAQSSASQSEIRAQKFILVDEAGGVRGVFGIENNEKNGAPAIEIIDSKGRVFATEFTPWSFAYGSGRLHPPGPKHPTLLPVKPRVSRYSKDA